MSQTSNTKYPDNHPDGIYRAKILQTLIGSSEQKQTPFLAIKIEILQLKKAKDGKTYNLKMGAHRTVKVWLTAKTVDKVRDLMNELGLPAGTVPTQLDPNHPKKVSAVGAEVDVTNAPEKDDKGKLWDRFDVLVGKGSKWGEKFGTANTGKLMQFEALFNAASSNAAPVTPRQLRQAEPDNTPKQQQTGNQAEDNAPPFAPDPNWDF